MIFSSFPPELWGFLGVLTGAVIPSIAGWLKDRDSHKHETNRELIHLLNERLNLQQESLVSMEKDLRDARERSYLMQDRSRLAVSLAAAHITRLNAHIDMGAPPPPPDMPADLGDYIREFLWDSDSHKVPLDKEMHCHE
nr:MAG TPA: YtxH-like protein [Caudoviricetes sp.]